MISELKHWLLDEDHIPYEVTFEQWASGISYEVRIVKQETVNVGTNSECWVSTIFIGLGECFTGRPYFETMIFDGPLDMYQERCQTYEQALEHHATAITLAKAGRRIKDEND